jgi:hypothetical protein
MTPIFEKMHFRVMQKGEILYQINEAYSFAHVVIFGQVNLYNHSLPEKVDFVEICHYFVKKMLPGNLFGCSIKDHKKVMESSAICKADGIIICLDSQVIDYIIQKDK